MKNFIKLIFAAILLVSFNTVKAQDEGNIWAFSIGINAVDPYPVGEDLPQGPFFDEFFNATDHWNILPSISRIRVSRYISNNIIASLGGSINRISKFGSVLDGSGEEISNSVPDLSYFSIDAEGLYSFKELINSKKVEPIAGLGGSYVFLDDESAFNLNALAGLRYWFSEKVGLEAQSTYKHSFDNAVIPKHFQHSVSLIFKFGGKDTDGDGVYDSSDLCPDVPGLKAFKGCPETDGDGVEDSKDECPDKPGTPELNGCTDTDGDGVLDKDDECPDTAGLVENKGCPYVDSDGDGLLDKDDECPDTPGEKENKGCPYTDTDGDGVLDKDDKCPDEYGFVEEQGCPKALPTKQELEELNVKYTRSILFDTGKATIKQESLATIDYVYEFLKKYTDAKFKVDGHSDNVGRASSNQKLSEARAKSVRDALVERGVDPSRITFFGFGSTRPIAPNNTAAGREQNRRVEITLNNR